LITHSIQFQLSEFADDYFRLLWTLSNVRSRFRKGRAPAIQQILVNAIRDNHCGSLALEILVNFLNRDWLAPLQPDLSGIGLSQETVPLFVRVPHYPPSPDVVPYILSIAQRTKLGIYLLIQYSENDAIALKLAELADGSIGARTIASSAKLRLILAIAGRDQVRAGWAGHRLLHEFLADILVKRSPIIASAVCLVQMALPLTEEHMALVRETRFVERFLATHSRATEAMISLVEFVLKALKETFSVDFLLVLPPMRTLLRREPIAWRDSAIAMLAAMGQYEQAAEEIRRLRLVDILASIESADDPRLIKLVK
jgi:hypothetical protein